MTPGDQIACSRELFLPGSRDSSELPWGCLPALESIFSGDYCLKSELAARCSSEIWRNGGGLCGSVALVELVQLALLAEPADCRANSIAAACCLQHSAV